MTSHEAALAYRRAATQQASVVGLVIALYDTLIGDLKRAAAAMERGDIEGRCQQLVHAFSVLQQLDSMLDMQNGGATAINVRRFYTHLRGQMLAAQFKLLPEILHDQARIVLEVRGAWQQVDTANYGADRNNTSSGYAANTFYDAGHQAEEHRPFSCTG